MAPTELRLIFKAPIYPEQLVPCIRDTDQRWHVGHSHISDTEVVHNFAA
jgi:hypothetical protein